jgi:hypothetical protein
LPPSQLDATRAFSHKALSKLPAQMRKAGHKDASMKLSFYISGNAPILQTLSFPLVLRILGTNPTHRDTAQQKATLARSALEDAIESLTRDGYPQAAELRTELAVGSAVLLCLAVEMVSACHGMVLK